jgi:hypothetical protein
MFDKDPKTMTDEEKRDFLKGTFAAMGKELTDSQLDMWSFLRTATITGNKPQEVSVSVDLLFAVFQVLDQMQAEITAQELELGQLPFDGSCSCPKHSWLMPAYNEIGKLLLQRGVTEKSLTAEFQYGMKIMRDKQHAAFMKNAERIGVPKKEDE